MKKILSKTSSRQSKLARLMKLPIRVLSRARDYYVQRMVDCTQMSRCPGAHGLGALPRSFSVASSSVVVDDHKSEDFRELVRAASVRTLMSSRSLVVGRSASVGVGMGRIDEESTSEVDVDEDDETRKLRFDERESCSLGGQKQRIVIWRSKSYAVPTKGAVF